MYGKVHRLRTFFFSSHFFFTTQSGIRLFFYYMSQQNRSDSVKKNILHVKKRVHWENNCSPKHHFRRKPIIYSAFRRLWLAAYFFSFYFTKHVNICFDFFFIYRFSRWRAFLLAIGWTTALFWTFWVVFYRPLELVSFFLLYITSLYIYIYI